MKIQVSDLTGAQLDYWVAKAEGLNPAAVIDYGREVYAENHGKGFEVSSYCTDWAQGGPIIERKNLTVAWQPMKGEWIAGTTSATMLEFRWRGFSKSPLIAAMRAYVSSMFGDEVDIPD